MKFKQKIKLLALFQKCIDRFRIYLNSVFDIELMSNKPNKLVTKK